MPDNSPCTCPVVWAFAPQVATITPGCPVHGEREAESLAAEVEPWLQQCGSCDAALPMSCTCPQGDYRNILLKVWRAYERSQVEVKALTKTAADLAYALGRKEAAEEIAARLNAEGADLTANSVRGSIWAATSATAFRAASKMAREIGTKENS